MGDILLLAILWGWALFGCVVCTAEGGLREWWAALIVLWGAMLGTTVGMIALVLQWASRTAHV